MLLGAEQSSSPTKLLHEAIHAEALGLTTQKLKVDLDGVPAVVIGREDLLKNKRAAGRPKDLVDAAWLEEQSSS